MQDKPVALVTGANQGIGLQIAKDLVAHGFIVLVGSRNLERGEAAAREIGQDARALQLDVTDAASIAAAAERVRAEFGRLNDEFADRDAYEGPTALAKELAPEQAIVAPGDYRTATRLRVPLN